MHKLIWWSNYIFINPYVSFVRASPDNDFRRKNRKPYNCFVSGIGKQIEMKLKKYDWFGLEIFCGNQHLQGI